MKITVQSNMVPFVIRAKSSIFARLFNKKDFGTVHSLASSKREEVVTSVENSRRMQNELELTNIVHQKSVVVLVSFQLSKTISSFFSLTFYYQG